MAPRLWVRACTRAYCRAVLLPRCISSQAETEFLAGPNGAGINADFPPACREIRVLHGPYLFDFIRGDATNKNCGMFLSKGR